MEVPPIYQHHYTSLPTRVIADPCLLYSYVDYDYDTLFGSLLGPLSPSGLPTDDHQSTTTVLGKADDTSIYVSLRDLEKSQCKSDQKWQRSVSDRQSWTHPLTTEDLPSGRGGLEVPLAAQRQWVRTQTKIIKDWFVNHPASPYVYPSATEIQELASASSLTLQQVRTCLTNLRTRIPSSGTSVTVVV